MSDSDVDYVSISELPAALQQRGNVQVDLKRSDILQSDSTLTCCSQLDSFKYESTTVKAAPVFAFKPVTLQPKLLYKAAFNGAGTMLYIPLADGFAIKMAFVRDEAKDNWSCKDANFSLGKALGQPWREAFNVSIYVHFACHYQSLSVGIDLELDAG